LLTKQAMALPLQKTRPDPLARLALDNMATSVLVFGADGRLRAANPAAESLLGLSARKIIGLLPAQILPEASGWLSLIGQAVAARRSFSERDLELLRPAVDPLLVDCTVTPIPDGGEAADLVVEISPVDRHRRIAREEHILAQQQTVSLLLRGLAHELRNPLGGLRGAAQLLERELADPSLREYTQVIIGEADRLQKLLDQLLGPRVRPRKRPVNVHQVAERVCALVKAEAPSGVRIRCDYDPSIPEITADPDMLIQAVLNVMRNAVQALGQEGVIELRTRVQRQVAVGPRFYRLAVRLDVTDNGPGIPPELVDKVFYPMVSGRPEGTGLGLSIAQSLVQQHGGLIQCASRPGETTMTILLPLEEPE
jgi:two-component system nitrogen regulation sensor histidine kinase GlnL